MNYEPLTMNSKKYILKPVKHQFAPGSHPVHDNDNLTDAEAEWYLKAYPHIASLFAPQPPEGGAGMQTKIKRKRMKPGKTTIKEVSALTPPLGGGGAT